MDKAATRVLFNDWSSDYSNTPDNWKPALTEAAKKKEHNEMLRDQLRKSYNWTPDKSIEIAYNAGGIAGQITQAVTIGKVLGTAGVGGQLATWGQKAALFGSSGAISGAINAYGEGKDTAGIIQESAITGAASVPFGFAGEYVGNKVGSLIQKAAPSVKNFVAGVNRGISYAGEETSRTSILLKQRGIPSTLSDAEIATANAVDLRAQLQTSLKTKDIHFMQSSIKNTTGGYTVLGNAEALKTGALKPGDLPVIRVWQDAQGKVWTLDHRRLGAFKLAGIEEIPVQWAPKSLVESQMWKMSTQTGGTSIKLKLGNGESIIVK